MKKIRDVDANSLWLDKLTSQVKEGGLDIRCALSLAFYGGELVGGKHKSDQPSLRSVNHLEDFPVEEEKI